MIEAGDIVQIVDFGETYSTYQSFLDYVSDRFNLKGFVLGGSAISHGPYAVLAVNDHLDFDDKLAVIHQDNKTAYLVGIKGLKVI
jgi:2-keto-4-pentenoate hydratase